MSDHRQLFGNPVMATATGTTSAVASLPAVIGTRYYITDISASSDKAGSVILVKDGTTVIWQDIVGAGNYRMSFNMPLSSTFANAVSVTVDGVSASNANLSGYSIA